MTPPPDTGTGSSTSTTTTTSSSDEPSTTRFRCSCGRSVAVPDDSVCADARRCTSCLRNRGHDEPLHRTDGT